MTTSTSSMTTLALLSILSLGAGYVLEASNVKTTMKPRPFFTQESLDTRRIGSLTVPTVGIGTISWSSDKIMSIENNEIQNVVDEAWKRNAVFIDTAERYGSHFKTAVGLGYHETEILTQKLLRKSEITNEKNNRLPPVVATKFTPTPWRTTVESVVKACEESRKSLNVDQIDLYQVHMPDIVKPFRFLGQDTTFDEVYWDGLAECYHRGLVKNVGVCNYGPTLVSRCQEHLAKRGVPLASNQIGYSLLGRHNGAQETLDKCQELGVEVMAFYPFAMGLLTGKYSSDMLELSEEEHLDKSSLSTSKKSNLEIKDLMKYAKGDGLSIPKGGISPLLRTMEEIAAKYGKTVAQVALNYIICKGAIPIPGARSVAQVSDNIGAMGWRLSSCDIKKLELEADNLGFGFDGAGFKRTSEKFVGYGTERFTLD